MGNSRFKFRIWNSAEMHYNDFVVTATAYVGKITEEFLGRCVFNQEDLTADKECILMQCTGLKDKNGKLIYEGDIVKINTWFDKIVPDDFEYRYENEKGFALYQIHFNQKKARFEAKCIKYTKEKPYRCFLLEYVPTNNEVIGNIYENKELLDE